MDMSFRLYAFLFLSGTLFLTACVKETLPYKTDPRGKRMVKSLHETDPNGTWGDLYLYHYEKGNLVLIENTEWKLVFPDTIKEYRQIRIGSDKIQAYRGNESIPFAGCSLKNGQIENSFSLVNGKRFECSFHYGIDGRLDSISGDTRVSFRWEDSYPSAYALFGNRFLNIAYLNEKNRTNLNLTDDLAGLDDQLFFYGWEIFAGLQTDRLIGKGPARYRNGRSNYTYTKDGYDCPVSIKETIDNKAIAYYWISYY